ncbi:MAG: peptidoglycan editing factor PgeF [Hyphomonadaceae bacterium]
MTETPDFTEAPSLGGLTLHVRHAFFGRRGGVSGGPFESLNCAYGSGDDLDHVMTNRARACAVLGAPPEKLVTVNQVHSARAVLAGDGPFPAGARPEADAIVSSTPGLALAILTADCAPILICDPAAGVAAAVHAGWRGAVDGVVEAATEAMVGLGADPSRMIAAIGPCLSQTSFEVGPDLVDRVLDISPWAETMFEPGDGDRSHFDLKKYLAGRMTRLGMSRVDALADDTLAEPDRYFSHRGAQKRGEPTAGRNLSVIMLLP